MSSAPPATPGPAKPTPLSRLTLRAVAGLCLGLSIGLLLLREQPAWAANLLAPAQAFVQGWTNAFRNLILPLVLAQLYVAVAGGRTPRGTAGRMGAVTPIVFVSLLAFIAFLSTVVMRWSLSLPWLSGLSLPSPENRGVADAAQIPIPSTEWVDRFLPPNLLGSEALLPLMIFTVGFALAARRLVPDMQATLLKGFEAVRGAMFVLVDWLLLATPLVLFGLGMTTATQAGATVGGALLGFTIIESVLLVIALAALYPVTVLLGGVTLRWFARAMLPAQIAAVSTRSSLATVPTLLKTAESGPGSVPAFASYVLPLAGAMLKLSRAVTGPVKLLFLAHVLGIPLTAERVVIFAATIILISPATVGVPRVTPATRSLPAYVAAGIPAEYVILVGAAVIVTDVFQTLLNTTSYMSANVLVGRFASRKEKAADPVAIPVRSLEGRETSGGAAA